MITQHSLGAMILIIGGVIGVFVMAVVVGKFLSGIKLKPPVKTSKPTPTTLSNKKKKQQTQPLKISGSPTQSTESKKDQPHRHIRNYFRVLNSATPQYSVTTNTNKTEAECKQACDNNFLCKWYNYNPKTKTCSLHNLNDNTGMDTGMRKKSNTYNIHVDKNIMGVPIIPPFATPYQVDCGNRCTQHSRCHWYTYNKKNKQCTLNSAQYVPGSIHVQKP